MVLFNQLHKPCGAEELAFAVHGLRDSVRVKHKNVSALARHRPLLIGYFLENAQRKACQSDLAATSILIQQRLRLPLVRTTKLVPASFPARQADRQECHLYPP